MTSPSTAAAVLTVFAESEAEGPLVMSKSTARLIAVYIQQLEERLKKAEDQAIVMIGEVPE